MERRGVKRDVLEKALVWWCPLHTAISFEVIADSLDLAYEVLNSEEKARVHRLQESLEEAIAESGEGKLSIMVMALIGTALMLITSAYLREEERNSRGDCAGYV